MALNVFCNGFPKSGSHALQKAVELLGAPAVRRHHTAKDGIPADATHHVLIVRDPRDVVVSWLRFEHKAVTPGTFLSAFRKFQSKSLIEEMAEFEPWRDHAGTHTVRYEDLIADDSAMRDLAVHLGVPYIDGAWTELEGENKDKGLTRTWNKIKSDHRLVWTKEVIEVWYAEGGGELLTRWGY